jgi:imidazole glycerol-phosphate synthase subunit HisH
MSVVVIDYGMGNLGSVRRALHDQGADVTVSGDPTQIRAADALVLPGVGAFAEGISNLNAMGLSDAIRHAVDNGCALLGICLGMQLLADEGDEGGRAAGLGLIPGSVTRLQPADPAVRVPHVGWNEVAVVRNCALMDGIANRSDFYFVHSYCFSPADAQYIVATTSHSSEFTSVVQRGNVFGTQFHPEKSSRVGCQLLSNFLQKAPARC